MPKKDACGVKEVKEKGSAERSVKSDTPIAKENKVINRKSMEEGMKKETPTSSKEKYFAGKMYLKEESNFELNSKVLCKYRDNLYYEAKVIAIDDNAEQGRTYTVHYQGWNSRHDEKIPQTDIEARFLQCTEENLEMARIEMQEARQFEKKRKRRFPGIGDEKKAGGTDSRSSTPSDKLPSGPASVASAEPGGRKGRGSANRVVATHAEIIEPPKKEIKIEMPLTLMELLVEDYDMITRQMHLAKLPARYTVDHIIKQYDEHVKEILPNYKEETHIRGRHEIWLRSDALIDCSLGVQDFFDATLGARLLYKFEYPQYDEILEQKIKEMKKEISSTEVTEENVAVSDDLFWEKKWKPSDTYGFIHLLRLLVKFGGFLGEAKWEEQGERSVLSIVEYVERFIKFLDENRQKFFDIEKDYCVASADHQKRFADAQVS